ncbi:Mce protein [Mycolicibacterium hodleri]|uniref:Mce protein n=1 Tax=Mycolicibacterium hodleri TaxID=49897 RepID=A0A502E7J4_9MYCO|nr:Mce protein [Mycolicibacterium hodleri]TPG32421.1 Mce protein [Mycolicibacterium hodleri]
MADNAAAPQVELSEPSSVTVSSGADEAVDVGLGGDVSDYDAGSDDDGVGAHATPTKQRMSHRRLTALAGLVMVVVLAGLVGWLGFRSHQSQQAKDQRDLFLQVGRQGAINLTTIDYADADTDVQRILDGATGTFYDDFSKRAKPFVGVVKQAQSKSVGTVTAAGLESESASDAQVLVAVNVKTSNAVGAEQPTRAWRMRIGVQKVGDQAKVSNVEFVP